MVLRAAVAFEQEEQVEAVVDHADGDVDIARLGLGLGGGDHGLDGGDVEELAGGQVGGRRESRDGDDEGGEFEHGGYAITGRTLGTGAKDALHISLASQDRQNPNWRRARFVDNQERVERKEQNGSCSQIFACVTLTGHRGERCESFVEFIFDPISKFDAVRSDALPDFEILLGFVGDLV